METLSHSGETVTQRGTMSSGKSFSVSQTASWSPAQVAVTAMGAGASGAGYSCEWHPAVLQFVFPMRPGQTWHSDSQCTVTANGTANTGRETVDASVQRADVVQIDGHAVGVWVIQRHQVITFTSASGSYRSDTQQTEWYAPPWNQAPRIETTTQTTGTYSGKTYSSTSHMSTRMASLRPR